MSFWGATVIISLASAIPIVGDTIITWLWDGFSLENSTLNNFFSPHYLPPLIIISVTILHFVAFKSFEQNFNKI
jgi:ubiquinol-cytochrome c reductase cytochrome b subunit